MIELSLVHQFEVGPDKKIWMEVDGSTEPVALLIREATNFGGGSTGEDWKANGPGIKLDCRMLNELRKGLDLAEAKIGETGRPETN
jgi:hypothetical protein